MLKDLFDQVRKLLQWWVVITPWEQGLRVRWGKTITLLRPGVHLRLPLVHSVYRQSVRKRYSSTSVQTVATADGKTLTLLLVVGYEVRDIRALYDRVHHAEDAIVALVESEACRYVTEQQRPIAPELLAAAVRDAVGPELRRWGLDQVEVRVTDFAYVRTFRLIGEQWRGTWGDKLNTTETVA